MPNKGKALNVNIKPLLDDIDWQEDAACSGTLRTSGGAKDQWFFPDKEQIKEGTWLTAVSRYCRGCPVRAQCEAFGRAHGSAGIWGGVLFNTEGNVVPSFTYWLKNGKLQVYSSHSKPKVA